MPELPEVETMRRGVRDVVSSRIADVIAVSCVLKPILISPRPATLRRRAMGRQIVGTARRGKRVVLQLDNQEALVFEPRMTGLLLVGEAPDREHLRLHIKLRGGRLRHLWYWDRRGLGRVQLLTASQLHDRLGPDRLGPDALDVSEECLKAQLGHSRREIKVALLDQQALAGIGNLYASEILHAAGIHPQKRCDQMTSWQWRKLHEAMQAVLQEAIRYEGSTLGDGTYRNALNQNGSYQNHHRVYKRAGQRCPTCQDSEIRRIVQAQRATFFCPSCQTKGRRRWLAAGP